MNSLFIAANLLKRATRQRPEFAAMILLPLVAMGVMILLFQLAYSGKPAFGLVNLDSGEHGQRLALNLRRKEDIKLINLAPSDMDAAVTGKRVRAVLVIPADFTQRVKAGLRVEVVAYSHGDSLESEALKQYINTYVIVLYSAESIGGEVARRTGRDREVLVAQVLNWMDERKVSTHLRVPARSKADDRALIQSMGFVLMFIMINMFGAVGTILRDRKNLTLARLHAAPVKRYEIAAGNLCGGLAQGMIQVVIVSLMTAIVFKVNSAREIAGLFLLLSGFLAATVGLGLVTAGVLKDNFNPTILIGGVIAPTCILGGAFSPDELMPRAIQLLGYGLPHKWVMMGIRELAAGAGVAAILPNLVVILLFAAVFTLLGARALKPLP